MMNIMIKKLIFKLIYNIYLWSSSSTNVFFDSPRYIEYPFIITNLKIEKGHKILLVGCVDDYLSTILPALGYETYGLDVKSVSFSYPHLEFHQGDIRKTNFSDNFFSAAIAVSTIEHVGMMDQDPNGDLTAITEMMRLVKTGGIILITVPVLSTCSQTQYERNYDAPSLMKLLDNISTYEITYFKKEHGSQWKRCTEKEIPAIHEGEAVALVNIKNE